MTTLLSNGPYLCYGAWEQLRPLAAEEGVEAGQQLCLADARRPRKAPEQHARQEKEELPSGHDPNIRKHPT